MRYEANVYQMIVEEHVFWVAESKVLKGCVGQGDTAEEAISELEVNENEWIQTAKEYDIPIPEVTYKKENSYSGKISLRMSPYLHEETAELATEQGVSINQYINNALVNYNAKVSSNSRKNSTVVNGYSEFSSKILPFKKAETKISIIHEELKEM